MLNKQFFRDTLLPLSVLVALIRLQWDPVSQQHRVEIPAIQDIILGESVALTETQFHNWYSTNYEDEYVHVHPKRVDSGVYSRSIFNELHTLNSRNRLLSLIPTGIEITTLLLDNDELYSPARGIAESNGNSENSENVHELSSSGGNGDLNNNLELEGAIASPDSGFAECQELSPEDVDLIEALWRQDIDMGVSRQNTFPAKVELEKPKDIDDKLPQNEWQYDIDCETGEHLLIPPTIPPPASIPSAPTQVSTVPDSSLSFEDCLNLLEGFNPEVDLHSSRVVPQLVDADEIEQRWQDLASLSELNPAHIDDNVFAVNFTTNGNVNLQNATSPQLPLLNNTGPSVANNSHLTLDIQDGPLFSLANETLMNTTSPDLFSPINRFNNMSIHGLPASPSNSSVSSTNLTMLMMDQQSLELPPTPEYPDISPAPQNGSLLLELLNSTEGASNGQEMDSDMQELDSMIDMLAAINREDGTPMEVLSDDDDSFSTVDSEDGVEGAAGFNQDAFKGELRKGYSRGGASPCHSDAGSSSSLDSGQYTDNIHHNHSYASSSDAGNQKNVRSSNNSRNSSSDDESQSRTSRDQKKATKLNIPISIDKIINMPVDNFNDLLKKYDFNTEQLQLIRDIRRRGKNKVAAQNCRKRKITAIQQVEGSVGTMQNDHDKLLKERDKMNEELTLMQERFEELHAQVFHNMRDHNGERLDPNQYRLEIMGDGSVILVPQNDTNATLDIQRPTDRKYSAN